jgi:hypothetical protein
MAFNWKAFQTAFMDDTARRIDERLKEAKDYRERQRELADKSKLQIQKRKALANLAVGKASQLSRLGVTDEQIAAAVASGPDALFTFADEVIEYANKQNIKKFTPTQIDALIETPELMKEDLGEDFTLDSFIRQSYGLAKPTPSSEAGTSVPLGLQLFGFGAKDRARAELDRDPYFEGYSIMDLNTLASQEAYESLIPGAYATFGGVPYNSVKVVGDFEADLAQAMKNREAEINAVSVNEGEEAANKLKQKIQQGVVQRYASMPWGQQFLNDPSVDIKTRFPDTYIALSALDDPENPVRKNVIEAVHEEVGQVQEYTDQDGKKITFKFTFDDNGIPIAGTLNGRTIPYSMLDKALDEAKSKGLYKNHVTLMADEGDVTGAAQPEVVTETLMSKPEPVEKRPAGKERAAKIAWDKKYKGKYNNEGTPIIVDPMPIEEGPRRQAWMSKYGETHDPDTGYPLPVEDTVDAIEEDTISSLVEKPETNTSLDIYNNPTSETYLIKIRGKIGTFRVKGEDLSAIPEAQIGTNVTIVEDTDPEKDYKKKSRSALERDFKPMGDERKALVEKPEVVAEEEVAPAQEENASDVINNFAASLTDFQKSNPKSIPSAFKRWAKENNISQSLTDTILKNIIQQTQ